MFDQRRDGLSLVQNVLVDGGYTGDPFAAGVQSLLGASVEVVKRNEMHTFVVLPKRWVVERSFAWLEKCRRLWKNCERKLNTSLQMVVLAFAALILKRLQTGSKMLLEVADWELMVDRKVPDRLGKPIVGIDLGGGRAWSSAVAVWENGRVEALALAPGIPDIASQEKRDRVPAGLYAGLVEGGTLTLAEGL